MSVPGVCVCVCAAMCFEYVSVHECECVSMGECV